MLTDFNLTLYLEAEDVKLLRRKDNAVFVIIWAFLLIIRILTKSFSHTDEFGKGRIIFTPLQILTWFFFAQKRNSNDLTKKDKIKFEKCSLIVFLQIISFSISFLICRVLPLMSTFLSENNSTWLLLNLNVVLSVIWAQLYFFSWNQMYIISFALLSSGILFLAETEYIISLALWSFYSIVAYDIVVQQDNLFVIAIKTFLLLFLLVLILIYVERYASIILNNACYVIFYLCVHSCVIEIFFNKIQQI